MRRLLAGSAAAILALAGAAAIGGGGALAQAKPCDNPRQMPGFKTCANVEKAEAEGTFVQYSTDPEKGQVALLKAFTDAFPKIKPTYVRLQAGALYAKINTERNARSYLADIMFISDMGMVQDFQRRNGWRQYVSPEMAAYKGEYKSKPEGFWTWGCIIVSGIAYNPNLVSADAAPKTWEDLLKPEFKDAMNVKVSNSGLQHLTWAMIKEAVSPDYWQKFGDLQPRAFDSYVQQFDRTVNGQDQMINTAQYSGYLQFKAKGAPIAFVAPTEGVTAAPSVMGAVDQAPHPEAAKLFMDWYTGVPGQKAYVEATALYSVRKDVPPPAGGEPITSFAKLLSPTDWDAFLKTHKQFVTEWDKMMGMR